MNRLQQEHSEWANKTFTSHFHVDDGTPRPTAPFRHLVDHKKGEIWELEAALHRGNKVEIARELADCQLLLYSIASLCGVDLEVASWEKYQINIRRKWGKPDEYGIVEHEREGE